MAAPRAKPRRVTGIDDARRWLLLACLVATAVLLLFFIAAPALGYPLEYPQTLRLLQLTAPVFSGYLGSMTIFGLKVMHRDPDTNFTGRASPLLNLIVKGPVVVFALGVATAVATFGYANRTGAPPGVGMSLDTLATMIAVCLALLTATTGAAVGTLFHHEAAVARDKAG